MFSTSQDAIASGEIGIDHLIESTMSTHLMITRRRARLSPVDHISLTPLMVQARSLGRVQRRIKEEQTKKKNGVRGQRIRDERGRFVGRVVIEAVHGGEDEKSERDVKKDEDVKNDEDDKSEGDMKSNEDARSERDVKNDEDEKNDSLLAVAQLQGDAARAVKEEQEERENAAGATAQLRREYEMDNLEKIYNFGSRDESP